MTDALLTHETYTEPDSPPAARYELRYYQADAIARINAAIEAGRKGVLLVIVTGGGKTVIAADVIGTYVATGKRVVVIVHREELVDQMAGKLSTGGVRFGFIKAGYPTQADAPVQIASIQTLHARAMRGSIIEMPPADLVIIDEAHHALAKTWKDVADYYTQAGAVIVGMTATPARGDGRGLGGVFDVMVQGPSVAELIEGGFLVKTTVYAPYRPDLVGVRTVAGDYSEKQLDERLNKRELVGDIVLHYLKINSDRRRTVVFAINVAHAVSICDAFRSAGIMAEVVHGGTPRDERRQILANLERGHLDVVVNCMVLTEGWDQPAVSCLILARPTKSLALYRQMVGRVLRPAPGKTDALIIDHSGATYDHGFAEDEIEWVLEVDRRATNKTQSSRGNQQPRKLLTCPECTALRTAGSPCPACGWRPTPKAQEIEVVDGDLEKVERSRTTKKGEYTAEDKHAWHRQLVWIAQSRDYKLGWAGNKYREKFGAWPQKRFVTPLPPTDEVSRWVKSRAIAWAKGRAKAGHA